jgi:hypothetical protein
MTTELSVETAERDLGGVLERLHWGDTVTLVRPDGTPLAVVISLQGAPDEAEPASDWEGEWDALADEVSQAWKSEKSALEVLSEMRR